MKAEPSHQVIRCERPAGAIDIAATFDADRARRRQRAREEALARTWRVRFRRFLGALPGRKGREHG